MMRRVEPSDFYRKGDLELDATAHELDELAARHVPTKAEWPECAACEQDWPCDASRLAARPQGDPGLLREAVENLLRNPVFPGDEGFTPTLTTVSVGHLAKLREALAATPAEPEAIDVERLADMAEMAAGEVMTGNDWGRYHKAIREHFKARLERAAEYARLSNPAQRETER